MPPDLVAVLIICFAVLFIMGGLVSLTIGWTKIAKDYENDTRFDFDESDGCTCEPGEPSEPVAGRGDCGCACRDGADYCNLDCCPCDKCDDKSDSEGSR